MTELVLEGELTSLDEIAFEAFIAERQRLGHDGHDEIWDGVYHVAPNAASSHGRIAGDVALALGRRAKSAGLVWSTGFNLGQARNYRVPDGAAYRPVADGVYLETAALVVEVLSPRDETFRKFDFYFARGVEELIVVDPVALRCRIWVRGEAGFLETDGSKLLDVRMSDLDKEITWT